MGKYVVISVVEGQDDPFDAKVMYFKSLEEAEKCKMICDTFSPRQTRVIITKRVIGG